MKTRIEKVDIYNVDIPFRLSFKHSVTERVSSSSVFVKAMLSDGTCGFGEGLPRPYVTGEDQAGVMDALKKAVPDTLLNRAFEDFEEAALYFRSFDRLNGAAKCAMELAVLDALGKCFRQPVSKVLGTANGAKLVYSAVISGDSIAKAAVTALKCRVYGMPQIKVKVGTGDDEKRLSVLRAILGSGADIRVDANGAWGAAEAIDIIKNLGRYRISAIEQPVPKDDIQGMKRVADAVHEPIMADESLCTRSDAEMLISAQACDMFNIRLSKCGGLIDSLEMAHMARRAGVSYQLGCQVGESGVLSAAGRHFASAVEGVRYLEGSFGTRLLVEDVVREKVMFGPGGRARKLTGFGLGVTVDEDRLSGYIKETYSIG